MYIVVEMQTTETVSTIVNAYDNINQAYSKYYDILKFASVSSVPRHGACIFTDDGQMFECKSFVHDVTE